MKQLSLLAITLLFAMSSWGQQYYRNIAENIPGNGQQLTDTINVHTLWQPALNSTFGLDSITLRLNYNNDEDLLISLTAPDGTVLQLANNLGGSGNNFNNTHFTMSVENLINMSSPPFAGKMRPESWIGRVNNGQSGIGKWILKIINTTTGNNTGSLFSWGVHFNYTPAPPQFFTQSSLPIIVVNTNNVVMQHNIKNEVAGTMGIIDNSNGINTVGNAFNAYNGNIAMKVRGSSSASFPQKSYTLTTTLANGDDNEVPLLGMGTGSKWVLYGAWNDKALMRNIITYQLSNEMGQYAPRTHLCELIINGDYKGVYVLMEKIKRDDNRVPVEKLNSSTVSGTALTGGYIFQVDRGQSNDSWQSAYPPCPGSSSPISFVYEYPADDKINSAQKTYIADYVDSFETALISGNLYDTVLGYRHYIDVPSFIDQSLLQELGHNVDGYRLSSFLHKAINKKLKAGPIWDFNLAFGNADYFNGSSTDNFQYNMPCPFNDNNLNPFWWKKLVTDTVYKNEYACRYTNLRQNVWDTVRIDALIDSLSNVLLVPQARHYNRWPILGLYVWPNVYVGNTWQEEVTYLKNWIHERMRWLDQELYTPSCIVAPPPPVSVTDKNREGLHIAVYPNPSHDQITFESKDVPIKTISVVNMTGQIVFTTSVNDKRFVLFSKESKMSKGIYTAIVQTERGTARSKIVVME